MLNLGDCRYQQNLEQLAEDLSSSDFGPNPEMVVQTLLNVMEQVEELKAKVDQLDKLVTNLAEINS